MTAERDSTMTIKTLSSEILDCENKAGDAGNFPMADLYRRWRLAIDAHLATRDAVVSAEGRFEQYVATLIDHNADIQKLGEWLGKRLDEDDFNTVAPMILGIAKKLKESSQKVAVPDGWMLVPIEPTEAMLEESRAHLQVGARDRGLFIWKAMLNAAPSDKSMLASRKVAVPEGFIAVPRDKFALIRQALHRSVPIPEVVRTFPGSDKAHREIYSFVESLERMLASQGEVK